MGIVSSLKESKTKTKVKRSRLGLPEEVQYHRMYNSNQYSYCIMNITH